jgi:hypothetical protein
MNVFEAAPKRFECLHLHHPMPKSGRNPHRPLIFFCLYAHAESQPPEGATNLLRMNTDLRRAEKVAR